MTPAAFYYHFASKDEILDEILADFAGEWSQLVSGLLGELLHPDDLIDFIDDVLTWIDDHERIATVYFVTSIGATSVGEALRKKTRDTLSRRASKAFAVMNPAKQPIDIAVAGLGLMTLLEVISRARLELDPSYRTLGPMRFRANAAALAGHLVN